VQRRADGVHEVYVAGVLVGTFEGPGERNVLLVKLSEEPRTRTGELAEAFGVSREIVRRAMRAYDTGGIVAVATVGRTGAPPKVTPELRRRAYASFARGLKVVATAKALRKWVSYGTVWRLRQEWIAQQAAEAPAPEAVQEALPLSSAANDVTSLAVEAPGSAITAEAAVESAPADVGSVLMALVDAAAQPVDRPALDNPALAEAFDRAEGEMTLEEAMDGGGHQVQHAGAWIALAMLHAMGIYRYAARYSASAVSLVALRIALDAVAVALVVGQRCVEGVRRVGTPSASTLLRAAGAASPSWTREVLHRFADVGAVLLHLAVAGDLIREGIDDNKRVTLYVDNHMRCYTGKHTVRKGWKMQERRAVPGTTDYYLHDADGQPLMRVDVPSHDSLPKWLRPIAEFCRSVLGSDTAVLLSFDRGGAYADEMAELRKGGFEFVTYERASYPLLATTAFDHELVLELDGKAEKLQWTETAQKNLSKGRGRVRRISVRTAEGSQINLLAISTLPADALIGIQLHRWRQENAFKLGVERWGINQLDGRSVGLTPADDIIPNPARRRLDHRLRFARAEEGRARSTLARLADDAPKRARYEEDLKRAMATQAELEAQRPHVPEHAAVKDTVLAGKLVRHDGRYKTAIDTLRVALANIESELATRLAPGLPRPTEAKKTLANLLAAPGRVRLSPGKIHVELAPAATDAERDAFDTLLRDLDKLDLTLPGDPERRRLRFRAQQL
jgi:transposase